MNEHIIEGEDFYYNENGLIVFTEKYHIKKGVCCSNGCKHCPYQYKAMPEPKRSQLLKNEKEK